MSESLLKPTQPETTLIDLKHLLLNDFRPREVYSGQGDNFANRAITFFFKPLTDPLDGMKYTIPATATTISTLFIDSTNGSPVFNTFHSLMEGMGTLATRIPENLSALSSIVPKDIWAQGLLFVTSALFASYLGWRGVGEGIKKIQGAEPLDTSELDKFIAIEYR